MDIANSYKRNGLDYHPLVHTKIMTYSVAKRALNGGFDLGEDGAGCGGGVGGLGDGASDN